MAAEELDNLFSTDASSSVQQIEENVHARLQEFLDSYESNESISDSAPYVLAGRFRIDVDAPLPVLDTNSAKAYAASLLSGDNAGFCALVIENDISYRFSASEVVAGVVHENALRLLANGRVFFGKEEKYKRVFIYERPALNSLESSLAKGNRYHERQISYQVVTPIFDYLKKLLEKGYSHGRINTENIFLGKQVVLGDCVSDRSGISQDPYFEPIERLLATEAGCGEPTEKTDIYSLGMVVYAMLFGLEKVRKIPIERYADLIEEKGAHSLLIGHKELSPTLDDFFRGIFVNDPAERWGLDQIGSWLDGKRFSLVLPGEPRDSSRGVFFNEKEYFSAPALATAMQKNWNLSFQRFESLKLDKWVESSPKLAGLADVVYQASQPIMQGGLGADDAMSRLLLTLDPHAPIRSKNTCVHLTGIGAALIKASQTNNSKVLSELTHMISTGLPQYSIDLNPQEPTSVMQHLLWQLPALRQLLMRRGAGFGTSRIVYEMNGALPCQAQLLQPYSITSPKEVLVVLDMLAREKAMNTPLDDLEVSAFLACKAGVMREQKVRSNIRASGANSNELVQINILAMVQNRMMKRRLPGLSTWVAIRLSDYINNIHSRKTRSALRGELVTAAKTGVIQDVLNVVFNGAIMENDQRNFKQAGDLYKRSDMAVERLQQKETFDRIVKSSGDRLSVSVGYILVFLTSMILLFEYLI